MSELIWHKMNSRQRIEAAINMHEVDRVPVAPFIMSFAAKFAGIPYSEYCLNYKKMAEAQTKVVDAFGVDMVTVDTDPYREAAGCGAVVEYPQDDQPLEKQPALKDKGRLSGLSVDRIMLSERVVDKIKGVEELSSGSRGEVPVLGWVESPFQNAAILGGLNRFLLDLYDDSTFVNELLEFTTRLAIAFSREQVRAGAHIIGVGDAIASMISQECYSINVVPYVKRVIAAIKESGAYVKYHICGDASHLLTEIKELGADIVNIDQKVDLGEARQVMNKTCIKGNIDPAGIILQETPAVIKKEARRCIQIGGAGYILSPGCELPRDTSDENLQALVDAAMEE